MLPFRTRLFLAFSLLWLLFLGGVLYLAGRGVEAALRGHLEATLLQDAQRAAEAYRKGQAGTLLTTGGVHLHLYTGEGEPLVLTREDHRLPREALKTLGDTPRVLWAEGFAWIAVRTPLGLLALTAEAEPIQRALSALRQALLQAFFLLFPLGTLLVYLTARLATRPLERAAREIAGRSPERLDPIPLSLSQDEFGRMVEAVNALLKALREAKERERAFLAEVGHELRTPLSGMGPLLEALTPRTKQEKEVLDLLKAEVARLSRLVQGLSPIQPGPRRPVELEEVWTRLEKLLGERLKGRRVEVQLPHTLITDLEALFQILLNLLENALKYGQDPIRVLSHAEGSRLHLEVRDRGEALTDYENLFLPGRRGTQEGFGQGLGLYLVRRLARALGGEAYAKREGEENVFGVSLPLD